MYYVKESKYMVCQCFIIRALGVFVVADHPGLIVSQFVFRGFPFINRELKNWTERALLIPDEFLRKQALASLQKKRFHAQGGGVYAIYTKKQAVPLTSFIVAIQTISDYLDNLCDRTDSINEKAFRLLHTAMSDSIAIDHPYRDYYADYKYKDDGGYLLALVEKCNTVAMLLEGYREVAPQALKFVHYYNHLQVYKHSPRPIREKAVSEWINKEFSQYPECRWWELACATGSTLGVFALLALAADGDVTNGEIQKITAAYFPWIIGLHILLDYFIDQSEDSSQGDLNFVAYYRSAQEIRDRLCFYLHRSLSLAEHLPRPSFHKTVILGMLAMYLTDRKVKEQGLGDIVRSVLNEAGIFAKGLHETCSCLRMLRVI